MPTDRSYLHIDKYLTNVAVNYADQEFVGQQLCPLVPVDFQTDKYKIFKREAMKPEAFGAGTPVWLDYRRPGGYAHEVTWEMSSDSYNCVEHAQMSFIPVEELRGSDPAVKVETKYVNNLLQKVALGREMVTATALITSGNYTTTPANVGWATPATDDILGNIETGMLAVQKLCGKRPNVFWCPPDVWKLIRANAAIKDWVKYTGRNLLSNTFAELIGVEKVVFTNAVYNSANPGLTDSMAFLLADYAGLLVVPNAPSDTELSWGYTFAWNGDGGGVANGSSVSRWSEPGRKSEGVMVSSYYDVKVVCKDAGYLFTSPGTA
jgi:hypothetical protein